MYLSRDSSFIKFYYTQIYRERYQEIDDTFQQF